MADMMPMAAPMGGGPVFDPNEQRWQDTVTTREPTHSRTTGQESGQLAPQTLAATEEMIAAQQNLAQTRAQAMPAAQAMDAAELARSEAMRKSAESAVTAQQAAAAEYEAKIQTAMAEMKVRGAQYAEAAKPEMQSFGSKIAAAIGMALGAYAATRAGTPNYAAQIVQMLQQKAEKEHEQRIAAALRLYESSGAAPGQIMAARKAAMEEIQAAKVARADVIESQYQEAMAKNPNHAQKLREEIAKKKVEDTTDRRNFLAQHLAQTTRESNTNEDTVRTTASVQGSPSEGGGANARAPMNVIDSYTSMNNRARDMKAGGDAIANEKAFEEWRKAYRDNLRTEIQKRGGFSGITNMGQVLGAVELNLADRLKSPEARAVNRAMIPIIATQGRKLDEQGAMSDMTIQKAEESLGLASTTAKEMAQMAYQMADDARAKSAAIEKQYPSLAQRPAGDAEAPAPRPKEPPRPQAAKASSGARSGSGIPPQVFKRIQEANRVKKGDPDYAEAQKYVREMAAKYGR